MTPDFDAIVIGAGVIGLAIARQFAEYGQQILVLETATCAGTETSARNSEVIHAGIYYPTNSLKARFCVEGRKQLYAFCAEHGVAARRVGKLIVATTDAEHAVLNLIQAQAVANGVVDLQWLSATDVTALEPEVQCSAALLSPSTGILDVQGFVLALQASAESFGTTLAFQTSFMSAQKCDGLFHVSAPMHFCSLTGCAKLLHATGQCETKRNPKISAFVFLFSESHMLSKSTIGNHVYYQAKPRSGFPLLSQLQAQEEHQHRRQVQLELNRKYG